MASLLDSTYRLTDDEPESLFERFHWLYAFCREHLFRDDTERIAAALWAGVAPPAGTRLLELGCGPGFYSCRLAQHFAHLQVTGIDRATRQLRRARRRAASRRLDNCRFAQADVLALARLGGAFDAVVSSRLFTILPQRERALGEMHRVLRPGGRCFVAEPRSVWRAALPLHLMWMLALLTGPCRMSSGSYREPRRIAVMTADEFRTLVESQPWVHVRRWQDAWYQYAVCEKAKVAGAQNHVGGPS